MPPCQTRKTISQPYLRCYAIRTAHLAAIPWAVCILAGDGKRLNAVPAFPAFRESQRDPEPQLRDSPHAPWLLHPGSLALTGEHLTGGKDPPRLTFFALLPQKTVPINSPTCWLAPGTNSMPSHLQIHLHNSKTSSLEVVISRVHRSFPFFF